MPRQPPNVCRVNMCPEHWLKGYSACVSLLSRWGQLVQGSEKVLFKTLGTVGISAVIKKKTLIFHSYPFIYSKVSCFQVGGRPDEATVWSCSWQSFTFLIRLIARSNSVTHTDTRVLLIDYLTHNAKQTFLPWTTEVLFFSLPPVSTYISQSQSVIPAPPGIITNNDCLCLPGLQLYNQESHSIHELFAKKNTNEKLHKLIKCLSNKSYNESISNYIFDWLRYQTHSSLHQSFFFVKIC